MEVDERIINIRVLYVSRQNKVKPTLKWSQWFIDRSLEDAKDLIQVSGCLKLDNLKESINHTNRELFISTFT
jgi:hypothetical protein